MTRIQMIQFLIVGFLMACTGALGVAFLPYWWKFVAGASLAVGVGLVFASILTLFEDEEDDEKEALNLPRDAYHDGGVILDIVGKRVRLYGGSPEYLVTDVTSDGVVDANCGPVKVRLTLVEMEKAIGWKGE